MPEYSTSVLSAGVDTLTCSATWRADGRELVDFAKGLMIDEAAHGSKVMPFTRAVYHGQQTQHVGWGQHDERVLVELRGKWAYDWWDVTVPLADRVSRIDVQVSVRQEPYDHDLALRLWRDDREKQTQRGRPSRFTLIAESDGGTTLYVGRGASRYQARLYERFYKEPVEGNKDVWRYEVQCRRERAEQVADLCRRAGDPPSWITGLVYQHFARRGVAPIFAPSADVGVAPLPKGETDREKSLHWLGASVAPALDRHRAWGSYDEAKRALRIPEP